MKRTVVLLAALALLLLAAGLAPLFKEDPGLVQIHFRDWTIETSVLVLGGALILLWLLFQLILKLYRLPAETARRVQERRALVNLERGLLALSEGDWRTAEKALEKSTGTEGRNTARYLAAAQAAHGQEADERSEYYLEQADSGGGFLIHHCGPGHDARRGRDGFGQLAERPIDCAVLLVVGALEIHEPPPGLASVPLLQFRQVPRGADLIAFLIGDRDPHAQVGLDLLDHHLVRRELKARDAAEFGSQCLFQGR